LPSVGIRLRLLEHLLEAFRRRLAVLKIRIDQRPALLLRRDDVRHQHRDLHVGRRAQAIGVLVAVLPCDLVGERLRGEKEHLLLASELGDRETDVREERAGDEIGPLPCDELFRDAHRVARIAAVVARDHLELLAEHAALRVDLLDRQLHALPIGLEKRRRCLVAVELADLDRLRRRRRD
jgi:hypothetical protein